MTRSGRSPRVHDALEGPAHLARWLASTGVAAHEVQVARPISSGRELRDALRRLAALVTSTIAAGRLGRARPSRAVRAVNAAAERGLVPTPPGARGVLRGTSERADPGRGCAVAARRGVDRPADRCRRRVAAGLPCPGLCPVLRQGPSAPRVVLDRVRQPRSRSPSLPAASGRPNRRVTAANEDDRGAPGTAATRSPPQPPHQRTQPGSGPSDHEPSGRSNHTRSRSSIPSTWIPGG